MASRRRLLLLGVPALAIAALLAVNTIDEDLSPQSRALYTRPAVPFEPGSGWALIAGFHAPAGEEPREYAARIRQVASQRKPGTARVPLGRSLTVKAADELVCIPQEFDCVRAYAQRPDSIANVAADNAVLLARYEELVRSRRLADVFEVFDYYEDMGPHFATVMRIQEIGLSQAAVNASQGRHEPAIGWLEADAAFQRAWLEEAGSILTKMLALRALSRDLIVAGQVARGAANMAPAQWGGLERVTAALTPAQRGVAPVLRVEAALFAGTLDHLLADSRTTSRIIEAPRTSAALLAATLRRNATLNFAYPLFDAWTTLDAVESNDLPARIELIRNRAREHTAPDWRWAYNFTGRALVAEQLPQFDEYVYRVRDLDALAAMIRCVVAMRRQGVAVEAAAAFVTSSAACVNPHDARPFAWDAAHSEVSFRPRGAGQIKRFGGRGDRVTFKAFAG